MNKDWTGNKKSTFATLGASNHTDHDRAEHDYYATEPKAIDYLLQVENFNGVVWENCCGEGHLSKRMQELGLMVVSTDLIDRGYGEGGVDFFEQNTAMGDHIITNPPYAYAQEWVEHSLELLHKNGELTHIGERRKLALFLPIQFLESAERRSLFEKTPPVRIHVFSSRILCGMNGCFFKRDKNGEIEYDRHGNPKKMSSAKCYAWFVWEIGNYGGKPVLDWIN